MTLTASGRPDFALSWRGHYHEVVHGYEQVTPLEPGERELIAPYYWLWILEGARGLLLDESREPGLGWVLGTLRCSTPLPPRGERQ